MCSFVQQTFVEGFTECGAGVEAAAMLRLLELTWFLRSRCFHSNGVRMDKIISESEKGWEVGAGDRGQRRDGGGGVGQS